MKFYGKYNKITLVNTTYYILPTLKTNKIQTKSLTLNTTVLINLNKMSCTS